MSTEEDIQELKEMMAALKQENTALKTRLSEVEDFAQTHIGMDWGQAGTSANVSHPNISADTVEYGGGVGRLTNEGGQLISQDSGDFISESPNAAIFKWLKDNFTGTPLAEIFGGYSTPTSITAASLILRALADGSDFAAANLGVWEETAGRWYPLLQVANTTATQVLFVGTTTPGSSSTPWLTLNRTDDDNFKLYIRQGATLVEVISTGTTNWIDLTDGGPTTLHTHSGGAFDYGKAITTSQGQNLP